MEKLRAKKAKQRERRDARRARNREKFAEEKERAKVVEREVQQRLRKKITK